MIVPATMEDLKRPLLRNADTGVFYKVDDEALERIRRHAFVRTYAPGEVLFRQNEPTVNLPVFIVLEGKFSVVHTYEDGRLQVAEDDPGVVIADVELLVKNVSLDVGRRIDPNRTWSTVTCEAAGKVLWVFPPEVLWETRSFALVRNLARLLALKLLRRDTYLAPEILGRPRRRIVAYLKELVQTSGTEPEETTDRIRVKAAVSQSDVARHLHVKQQNVSSLYTRSWQKRGLSWEGRQISMSAEFLDLLLHHTDQLTSRSRVDVSCSR